ncbi:MAG: hypothetical protein ABIJ08_00290, partial [Nanoarchaeota archaeon]
SGDNPEIVPDGLTNDMLVFVCGAYSERFGKQCVDRQLGALKDAGMDARIYEPGTVYLDQLNC